MDRPRPNRRRRRWPKIAAGAVAVGGAVAAAAHFLAPPPPLTVTVELGPFAETVAARGMIDYSLVRELRAPASPYDRQVIWLVPEGARVKAGDIVAQFDVAPVERRLENTTGKATALQQTQESERARWTIDLFQEEIRRDQQEEGRDLAALRMRGTALEPPVPRTIGEVEHSIANRAAEDAGRRVGTFTRQRDLELRRRSGWINKTERYLDRLQDDRDDYVIRAPIDSIVVYPPIPLDGITRKVEPGDYLAWNQPFAQLPDSTTRVLRLRVEEHQVRRVRPKATVTFRAKALPGREFTARVRAVSTLAAEVAGRTRSPRKFFEVTATIDESGAAASLQPGMVADATIRVSDHRAVFAVPKDLVATGGAGRELRCRGAGGRTRTLPLPKPVAETEDYYLLKPSPELPPAPLEIVALTR